MQHDGGFRLAFQETTVPAFIPESLGDHDAPGSSQRLDSTPHHEQTSRATLSENGSCSHVLHRDDAVVACGPCGVGAPRASPRGSPRGPPRAHILKEEDEATPLHRTPVPSMGRVGDAFQV